MVAVPIDGRFPAIRTDAALPCRAPNRAHSPRKRGRAARREPPPRRVSSCRRTPLSLAPTWNSRAASLSRFARTVTAYAHPDALQTSSLPGHPINSGHVQACPPRPFSPRVHREPLESLRLRKETDYRAKTCWPSSKRPAGQPPLSTNSHGDTSSRIVIAQTNSSKSSVACSWAIRLGHGQPRLSRWDAYGEPSPAMGGPTVSLSTISDWPRRVSHSRPPVGESMCTRWPESCLTRLARSLPFPMPSSV